MRQITSSDNPHFRAWLKLRDSSRERRKTGISLLDGAHLVAAYVEHIGAPDELIVSRSGMKDTEISALIAQPGMPEPIVLSEALFRELSSVATPTGILALVNTPRPLALRAVTGPCVMLEGIQDPGNLGSILRSAAAAAVNEIYLSCNSVHSWSPRVLRAGMGAHFALQIHEDVDLTALVRSYAGQVLAAVPDAPTPFYAANLKGNVALLFGNEGKGLSAELRDSAHLEISIPMAGKTESVNVAAAAAVCLFERVRQQAKRSKS